MEIIRFYNHSRKGIRHNILPYLQTSDVKVFSCKTSQAAAINFVFSASDTNVTNDFCGSYFTSYYRYRWYYLPTLLCNFGFRFLRLGELIMMVSSLTIKKLFLFCGGLVIKTMPCIGDYLTVKSF